MDSPIVKELEKVLYFVIETRAQFYATFYKSRAARLTRYCDLSSPESEGAPKMGIRKSQMALEHIFSSFYFCRNFSCCKKGFMLFLLLLYISP